MEKRSGSTNFVVFGFGLACLAGNSDTIANLGSQLLNQWLAILLQGQRVEAKEAMSKAVDKAVLSCICIVADRCKESSS
jgi:hypothetical protein